MPKHFPATGLNNLANKGKEGRKKNKISIFNLETWWLVPDEPVEFEK